MTVSKKVYFGLIEEELSDESHTSRVVDYKWLSNQCSVNVNEAKEMLYEYSLENSVHVTYLIAGQPKDHSSPFQLQLVSSDKLEQVKQSFEKIISIHVHSLSKSHPTTVSDLYRMDSNTDFSYTKCGTIEHPSKIEMKSKIKHMEIVKPALPPMEIKPSIKKSPKKESTSSSAGKITNFTTKKPSPKKSTPIKEETKFELSDDEEDKPIKDVKKKKTIVDDDDLVLDEESDQEMKDASEEEETKSTTPTKKTTKKSTTKSKSKSSASDKKKSPKSSTLTIDKFTSSPVKAPTTAGERPTKRVKQIVSVKNEKGYLVSKEVWTDVPLTDEEIRQQEALAKKVKKELSDDEDAMKVDEPEADSKKKKEATKKTVVKASNNGKQQSSISSFFKKK